MADVYLGSVYAKLELKTDDLNGQIKSAEKTLTNLGRKANDSASSIDNSFVNVARSISGNFSGAFNKAADGFDKLSNSVSGLDQFLTRVTAGLTTASVAVAKSGISGGLALAQQLEDAETGLKFILKSSEKAEQVMKRVRVEAERTPFDVGNLSSLTQQLSTFTKDGNKAIDVLMAMGSATVASGRGVEDLERAAINLGQAFNNSWTQMDYKQMLNAVPMFKTIADQYGLTWEKMKAIQKSGTKNLGEELTRVFSDWGAKNDVFASTQQNLSQLKASFEEVFNGAFYDALKTSGGINQIKKTIERSRDALESNKQVLSDLFREVFKFVGQIDINAVIRTAVGILRGGVSVLKTVGGVITSIAKVLGGGDFNKGIERLTKIVLYSTVAVKGLKIFANVGSTLSRTLGGLFGVFEKFSGKSIGGGAGNAIAGVLKPLGGTEVLKGAASAALVGVSLVLIAKAIGDAMGINYDPVKMLAFATCVVAAGGIMALLGKFSQYATVGGIASIVIGVGLVSVAVGLRHASDAMNTVSAKSIFKFLAVLGGVSLVMGILGSFAQFTMLGGVASAVIGGGLLVSAIGLREASKIYKDINKHELVKFSVTLGVVSVVLGLISGFAVFGAVGSIANMIISGGLLVCAIALREVANQINGVSKTELLKFAGLMGTIDLILGSLSAFAVLGVVGTVANTIIAGGLLASAIALVETAKYARQLKKEDYNNMQKVLQKIASFDTGDLLTNLKNLISTGLLLGVANHVRDAITALTGLQPIPEDSIESLKKNITSLSQLQTSGVIKSIKDMFATANLKEVASNVRSIVNDLSGLPELPDNGTIDRLKDTIHNLSSIQLNGGGFFENRGAKASELAVIVSKIREMANNLSGFPDIDYDKVVRFVDALNVFDRIGSNTRVGLMRLSQVKDALANIDWIKHIIGDIPDNLPEKAQHLVDAIGKFDGINFDAGKIKAVGDAIDSIVGSVNNQIGTLINTMADVGRESANAFVGAIQSKLGDAYNQGSAMGGKLKEGLQSVNNAIASIGADAQGKYWNAIESKMNDEYWQGRALANKLVDGLRSVDTTESGRFAVQGFINGANSQNPYSTGWNIANKFLQGLKAKGREGSPWKSTFQSGRWAGEGFANGIKRSKDLVGTAANSIADVAMSAMKLDEFNQMMVKPDMSSVYKSMAQVSTTIQPSVKNNPSETNIYGDIHITPNGDNESVLDELSRATTMVNRGMATRV